MEIQSNWTYLDNEGPRMEQEATPTDEQIDELLRRLKPELFHGFAMMFQPEYRQTVRDWLSTL